MGNNANIYINGVTISPISASCIQGHYSVGSVKKVVIENKVDVDYFIVWENVLPSEKIQDLHNLYKGEILSLFDLGFQFTVLLRGAIMYYTEKRLFVLQLPDNKLCFDVLLAGRKHMTLEIEFATTASSSLTNDEETREYKQVVMQIKSAVCNIKHHCLLVVWLLAGYW